MRATLDHTEMVTAYATTFWFKPEHLVRYIAGQFTELYLPHNNPDSRGERRWFTLSSSPTEPLLAITTNFAKTESSTFKQALLHLAPGDTVSLAEPMGDFVLPKDPLVPLVFVAIGVGITPLRSMVTWLRDSGGVRDITLIYAVRSPDELAYQQLFAEYNLRFVPLVKNPPSTWKGETGAPTAEYILAHAKKTALVYVSGPEQLVEVLQHDLQATHFDMSRLVVDFFHGYNPA